MIVGLLLALFLLLYLLMPVGKRAVTFDEQKAIIAHYRQEQRYIHRQFQQQFIDGKTHQQLLKDLDKQSAEAMLAVKTKPYAYRHDRLSKVIVIVVLLASMAVYSYFYHRTGVWNWQQSKKNWQTLHLDRLQDESQLRKRLSEANTKQAREWCFHWQQQLLSQKRFSAPAYNYLAQCHLLTGNAALAAQAVTRALTLDADHIDSIYTLAELEFLQSQMLSPITEKKLIELVEKDPDAVDMLYLLTLNSFTQGDFVKAKRWLNQLETHLDDYPMLRKTLELIAPQIDAQLYMQGDTP